MLNDNYYSVQYDEDAIKMLALKSKKVLHIVQHAMDWWPLPTCHCITEVTFFYLLDNLPFAICKIQLKKSNEHFQQGTIPQTSCIEAIIDSF